jgi:hypothetical protein
MKHEVVLFFKGPIFQWSGKVDDREVICKRPFRWKWLAEGWAKGRLSGLSNCGYVVNQIKSHGPPWRVADDVT